MKKLYEYLTLEHAAFTLNYLDEQVKMVNIDNNWNPDKYITLQPYKDGIWMINFFGQAENLYFRRTEENPKYYKRIKL